MNKKQTILINFILIFLIFSSFESNATETVWGVNKGEVYNFIYDDLVIEGDFFHPFSYRYLPPLNDLGLSVLTSYPISSGLEVSIEIVDVFY